MDTNNRPIFLQSIWRTTSTYWWAQRRADPAFKCFCEPLHEGLLNATAESFAEAHRTFGKSLRHPHKETHQFSEYPLKPEGGVPGFKERFSLHDFYLRAGDADDDLKTYISGLIENAGETGQRPFFKVVRGFLRGEWMAANFAGDHIYLNRNPAGIMQSFMSFHGKYSYYFRQLGEILHNNADAPLFAEFAKWSGHDRDAKAYMKQDRQLLADMVGFFWLLGLAQASRYADYIIDGDRLADPAAKEDIARRLTLATNAAWDLSDYRHKEPADHNLVVSPQARPIIARAAALMKPEWENLATPMIAPRTQQQIEMILG